MLLFDPEKVSFFCQNRDEEHGGSPLSLLTGGIHTHTLLCPDNRSFEDCVRELKEAGILLE